MQSLLGIEGEVDRDDVWLIEARARKPSELARPSTSRHWSRVNSWINTGDWMARRRFQYRRCWMPVLMAAGRRTPRLSTRWGKQNGGSGGDERRPCAEQRAHLEGRQRRARADPPPAKNSATVKPEAATSPSTISLTPANAGRRGQSARPRDPCADEQTDWLADQRGQRQAEGAPVQRTQRHTGGDDPEQQQHDLRGMARPAFEPAQRIVGAWRCLGEEAAVAPSVRDGRTGTEREGGLEDLRNRARTRRARQPR